ncbi:hypothetical protein [Arthrobacter sp. A5]|uniref:hypothetical protein n=1 Tax=Arthrobacter sp. A5 TaxID=576926 RepID=UPI003DA9BCC4
MDNVHPVITSRVVFDRIRQDHDIADLEVRFVYPEQLKAMIRDYVLPYMDYPEFDLHITQDKGLIDAVTYNAGNFTITTENPAVADEAGTGTGENLVPGRKTLNNERTLQSAAQNHLDATMRLEETKQQLAQLIRTAAGKHPNPEWIADQTGLNLNVAEQVLSVALFDGGRVVSSGDG